MPQAAKRALLAAYQDQLEWLKMQVREFESGTRKVVAIDANGEEVDITRETAMEYQHKAGNMEAIIMAFNRLAAREESIGE